MTLNICIKLASLSIVTALVMLPVEESILKKLESAVVEVIVYTISSCSLSVADTVPIVVPSHNRLLKLKSKCVIVQVSYLQVLLR